MKIEEFVDALDVQVGEGFEVWSETEGNDWIFNIRMKEEHPAHPAIGPRLARLSYAQDGELAMSMAENIASVIHEEVIELLGESDKQDGPVASGG